MKAGVQLYASEAPNSREDMTQRSLVDKIASHPDVRSSTRFGPLGIALRRLILRLLRHYREHQHSVDALLVSEITATKARLSELGERLEGIALRVSELRSTLSPVIPNPPSEHQTESSKTLQPADLDALTLAFASIHTDFSESFDSGTRMNTWSSRLHARLGDGHNRPAATVRPAVSLDTDLGPLLYPDDDVMAPIVSEKGHWDAEEGNLLRSLLRDGSTFLDIGAHVGYFSIMAAREVGPSGLVISVEPARSNYALLLANLFRHGVTNAEPINAAAWRDVGRLNLVRSPYNSGDHRIASRVAGHTEAVQAVALDKVLPSTASVDVLKIDIQGRDHVAMEGMTNTIQRSRPVVLVEFWPHGIRDFGDDPTDVLDFYRQHGFLIRVLEDGQVDGHSNESIITFAMKWGETGFCTLVLMPVDRSYS